MTDTALPVAMTLSSGNERIFPTLTPAQIKRIAAHGQVRSIRSGEVLVEAGAHVVPFFVVTAGRGEGIKATARFTAPPRVLGGGAVICRETKTFCVPAAR